MSRPLHFFGGFGALGILAGSTISAILLGFKVLEPNQNVMDQHGPMFVIGAVLIVAGLQMLAIGMLGELQVRHHFTNQHPTPYAIDRLVRLASPEEQSLLSEERESGF